MVLYLTYVVLVLLVTVGGLLALAYTTREFRSDRGFASDLALTALVAAFIIALAWTTVLGS